MLPGLGQRIGTGCVHRTVVACGSVSCDRGQWPVVAQGRSAHTVSSFEQRSQEYTLQNTLYCIGKSGTHTTQHPALYKEVRNTNYSTP